MTTLFISHSSKDKDWANEIHARLRKEGYEGLFLDSHPDDGIHAGAEWEKELYRNLRQSRGLVVLCTANWLASPWCVAEAMMARERAKPVFMLASKDLGDGLLVGNADGFERSVEIPGFLKDTQFIPVADWSKKQAYQALWSGLNKELRHQDSFSLPESGRPYPGLEPFQEDDAAVFFGRDHEIQRVESALMRRRRDNAEGFVLVLGASGCGKSSLVRAGVVPKLKRLIGEPGSDLQWVIPPAFAASRGLEGLAVALGHAFEELGQPAALKELRQRLRLAVPTDGGTEPAVQALVEIASELLYASKRPEASVLLVLDQLEEVFGTGAGSEARALLRLMLEVSAADAGNRPVVLATMRSDFMNAFQSFPGATDRYKEVPLDPMSPARFGEVIQGPAERFGLDLGAGLTERLIEDTRHDDALPLLAFTLEKLYEKGGGDGVLELKEYEALFPPVSVLEPDGKTTYRGVSAAIKHVADEILEETGYAALSEDEPRMRDLRRAFYSLARVGSEGQFTRRVAHCSQMPASCKQVLDCFVNRRLLVIGTEAGAATQEAEEPAAAHQEEAPTAIQTIAVAHEALFRVWDTLNGWLHEDRKALALRAQIEDAAAEWDREGRAESRAWSEERILDAVREIERSGVSLADVRDQTIVDAFLGPTSPEQLEALPGLGEPQDDAAGSGRYGAAWQLPLGHEARASVGVRLALLGDHRPGVGLRNGLPDIDWCPVEGGEVTIEIRSNPDDPNSEVVDTLARSVEPFSMARYPVTIAQFQAFLSDCYRDGRWRLPSGFPVDVPEDYRPPKHRARYGNHPADSVNWYDALAFCHWLSSRTGQAIRLPTEFEWQFAATGGDPARTHPWGGVWDPEQQPWRANTAESELGRSTAVGLYPLGASKTGIEDMAGTLWEWCVNAFDDPDDTGLPATDGDRRVVRGGSWYLNRDFARSADRNWDYPYLRLKRVGFRVVCGSPITNR